MSSDAQSKIPWKILLDVLDPRLEFVQVPDGISVSRESAEREVRVRLIEYATEVPEPESAVRNVYSRLLNPNNSSLLDNVRSADDPANYLHKVIRNAGIDQLRKIPLSSQHDVEQIADDTADQVAILEAMEREAEEAQAVEILSTHFAEALESRKLRTEDFELLRKKYQGRSIGELAKEYRISYSAMAQRLHRALVRYQVFFSRLSPQVLIQEEFAKCLVAAMEELVKKI